MRSADKTFLFLSASDRLNYGDLLFPLIFKEVLDERYNFYNYGLVKSDLSTYGGLKTENFKSLRKNIKAAKNPFLVIGGGEVLFAPSDRLMAFISPRYSRLKKSYKFRRIETKFPIIKKLFNIPEENCPFCFNPSHLNENTKVFYSSVGGNYPQRNLLESEEEYKKNIEQAELFSVRDKRSHNSFNKYHNEVKLVPDSAIIMSDIYSKKTLNRYLDDGFIEKKYMFLQLGINKGPKDIHAFANQINHLSERLDLSILCCPLGMAPGHEDHVILKKIMTLLTRASFVMPKHILEIMALIAHSGLYLGTSLHGAITAQSFEVPFYGLNRSIPKLVSYIDTWCPCFKVIDFENVLNVAYEMENRNDKNPFSDLSKQKTKVYNNLNRIING